MIEHNLEQDTDEWHELRAAHDTASMAPVVMGVKGAFTKRDDYIKQVAMGLPADEPNEFVKQLWQNGHDAEAAARPLLEWIDGIDETFEPIVATHETENMLASLDGINEGRTRNWEHKLWNKTLPDKIKAENIPPKYYWQLEQQMFVSGTTETIFMCSDGTEANMEWCIYKPVKGRIKKLIAAWKQFHIDVEEYRKKHINGYGEDGEASAEDGEEPISAAISGEPSESPEEAPEIPDEVEAVVVTKQGESLPAIRYQMKGMDLQSNLDTYVDAANDLVERSMVKINDEAGFVEAEKNIKSMVKAEDYLDTIKAQVLSEVVSIDEFNKGVDNIKASIRDARLNTEKQVTKRKGEIKQEVVDSGYNQFSAYLNGINEGLGEFSLPTIVADFNGAVKGKRNIDSLKAAANDHLADLKIQISETAEVVRARAAHYAEVSEGFEILFPDLHKIIHEEGFADKVTARISQHKLAEKEKKEEQERIEAEELEALRIKDEEAAAEATKQEELAAAGQPEDDIIEEEIVETGGTETANDGGLDDGFSDDEDDEPEPAQQQAQIPAPRTQEPASKGRPVMNEAQEKRYKIHIAVKETLKAFGVEDDVATDLIKAISKNEVPRLFINYE